MITLGLISFKSLANFSWLSYQARRLTVGATFNACYLRNLSSGVEMLLTGHDDYDIDSSNSIAFAFADEFVCIFDCNDASKVESNAGSGASRSATSLGAKSQSRSRAR